MGNPDSAVTLSANLTICDHLIFSTPLFCITQYKINMLTSKCCVPFILELYQALQTVLIRWGGSATKCTNSPGKKILGALYLTPDLRNFEIECNLKNRLLLLAPLATMHSTVNPAFWSVLIAFHAMWIKYNLHQHLKKIQNLWDIMFSNVELYL